MPPSHGEEAEKGPEAEETQCVRPGSDFVEVPILGCGGKEEHREDEPVDEPIRQGMTTAPLV